MGVGGSDGGRGLFDGDVKRELKTHTTYKLVKFI